MSQTWSSTDFPYMCLKDERRTVAFREAIGRVVRPGDVVLDVGAGTGILSFFAAEAGAAHVYAVEIDATLARCLRRSVELNDFGGRITVIEDDVVTAALPLHADVVVAELIETGLLDEQQVPALNALRARGVITSTTRLVPCGYRTSLQLVNADHEYYGYAVTAPKHEWPFYSQGLGWHPTATRAASDAVTIAELDFERGVVEPTISGTARLQVDPLTIVNGVRLSGVIELAKGLELGPTHAVNGDKTLFLPSVSGATEVELRWSMEMGGGLDRLVVTCAPSVAHSPP